MVKIGSSRYIKGAMPTYAFGPFTLDPADRRLTRNGRRVAVPAKAWQILLLMAEAGGRLVPHETFRAKLWPNVVVEDRTLTVHVSTLRKALGSRPARGLYRDGDRGRLSPGRAGTYSLGGRSAPPVAGGPPTAEARPVAVRTFSTGDLAEADTYLGVGIADAVTTALGGAAWPGRIAGRRGRRISPARGRWGSATCWRGRCSAVQTNCMSLHG